LAMTQYARTCERRLDCLMSVDPFRPKLGQTRGAWGVLCNDKTHIQWVSLWNSARQQPSSTSPGLIAFMKGAFSGGIAIIGIPLLALVMHPLRAGALLAPLFVRRPRPPSPSSGVGS